MVISMKRDDVVSLRKGRGNITVRCTYGTVWVTVAGDCTDYILSSGQSLASLRKGKIVIMAQKNSSLEISGNAAPEARVHMDLTTVQAANVCQEMRFR